MSEISVTGYSDDSIVLKGAIKEQFYIGTGDVSNLLVFSDGTILEIEYTSDAVWKIVQINAGEAELERADDEGRDYSDFVRLHGDFDFVVRTESKKGEHDLHYISEGNPDESS